MTTRKIVAQTRFKTIPEPTSLRLLFGRRPIKGYRKERIISAHEPYGNSQRIALSDVLQPNGLIPAPADPGAPCTGVLMWQDTIAPQSVFCLNGGQDATDGAAALRRLRGGATLRPNPATGTYESHHHMFRARNRLFEQNTNDLSTRPSGCKPVVLTSSNNSFSYTWVDGSEHAVQIPPGQYYADDMGDAIIAAQLANKHYLIRESTGTYVTAIRLAQLPDSRISITCALISVAEFPVGQFSLPENSVWEMPQEGIVPTVTIHANNGFGQIIGFASGNYPNMPIVEADAHFFQSEEGSPAFSTAQVFISSFPPLMNPEFKPRPPFSHRNPQYGQDAAVHSRDRLFRLKYNTITTTAGTMRDAFGSSTASAMAYNTHSEPARTIKDKLSGPCRSFNAGLNRASVSCDK